MPVVAAIVFFACVLCYEKVNALHQQGRPKTQQALIVRFDGGKVDEGAMGHHPVPMFAP